MAQHEIPGVKQVTVIPCEAAKNGICVRKGDALGMCGMDGTPQEQILYQGMYGIRTPNDVPGCPIGVDYLLGKVLTNKESRGSVTFLTFEEDPTALWIGRPNNPDLQIVNGRFIQRGLK